MYVFVCRYVTCIVQHNLLAYTTSPCGGIKYFYNACHWNKMHIMMPSASAGLNIYPWKLTYPTAVHNVLAVQQQHVRICSYVIAPCKWAAAVHASQHLKGPDAKKAQYGGYMIVPNHNIIYLTVLAYVNACHT